MSFFDPRVIAIINRDKSRFYVQTETVYTYNSIIRIIYYIYIYMY